MIKIDLDAFLDLLIPYEGSVHEIQISRGKVRFMKSDGTSQVVPLDQLQKKEGDEEAQQIKSELQKARTHIPKPFVKAKKKRAAPYWEYQEIR